MLEARQGRRHRAGRVTYLSDVSVALLLSAFESAEAPAGPISLCRRLQREEEGQECSWRDKAAGSELGARDLLERRQRRVALERLRERRKRLRKHRGRRVAEPAVLRPKAAAKREGSGTPVVEKGPPAQSRARATYSSDVTKLNAFASFLRFFPISSSRSTTALSSIFASPTNAASDVCLRNSSLNRDAPAPFTSPRLRLLSLNARCACLLRGALSSAARCRRPPMPQRLPREQGAR